MFIDRSIQDQLCKSSSSFPVVALIGPRQSGKTTLVKHLVSPERKCGGIRDPLYLDLERPSDLAKLDDPESLFTVNAGRTICLDEIQRRPDLFPVIRSHSDDVGRNGMFLLTGSASPDLLRQGSESLAGRIAFHELTPFTYREVSETYSLSDQLVRGGYPKSLLSQNDEDSFEWRLHFIRTFLERDLGQFGFNIPVVLVRRLWRMLAHLHGQMLNHSQLSGALGVSGPTARKYVELLAGTFMIRILKPYHANLKKRLVKTPKVFLRDTGILNTLLDIRDMNGLLGHPVYGSLWEGLVIENLIEEFRECDACFFRSGHGAEIDLILHSRHGPVAIECKASTAPRPSRGFHVASADIKARLKLVVAPVDDWWPISDDVEVHSLHSARMRVSEFLRT